MLKLQLMSQVHAHIGITNWTQWDIKEKEGGEEGRGGEERERHRRQTETERDREAGKETNWRREVWSRLKGKKRKDKINICCLPE